MLVAVGSRSSRLVVLLGLVGGAAFVACGPSQGHPGGTGNGADAAGSGTGTGTNGDPDGGGSGTGNQPDAAACASSPHKAETAPLDMYIMLDQSGSMEGAKWTAVTGALKTFVTQPNLDGFSVGLQYFGVTGATTTCPTSCTQDSDCGSGNLCFQNQCICLGGLGGDSCTSSDYAKPEVEIAALPGVSGSITASLAAHSPTTGTPTSAALQGAIDHAKAWSTSHPGDVVIDVLATDGDPEECDTNLTDIDNIAKAGATGDPKILTFVIGVGSSLTNLNGIAAAGGTTSAFLVDTNGNAGQQFLDALNQIRGTALGCNYSIPLPTSGNPDFNNVTVTYHPSTGGTKSIPHVANMAACPSSGDGWYYDNNASPTSILLCKATCSTVTADSTGEVDIYTPCTVVVN